MMSNHVEYLLMKLDSDVKDERDRLIFKRWLACWTQQEIADEVGLSRPQVTEILSEMAELPKPTKPSSEHNAGDSGRGWCSTTDCGGHYTENGRIAEIGKTFF
jgi:hypothetical protein